MFNVTSQGIVLKYPKLGSIYKGEYYNDLILMQYTGLHDKNGIEIYESDIYKECDLHGVIEYYRNRFIVEFNNGTVSYPCELGEVIGNIHENKELLKWANG